MLVYTAPLALGDLFVCEFLVPPTTKWWEQLLVVQQQIEKKNGTDSGDQERANASIRDPSFVS
jgi:hypothetical protein